MRGAGQFAVIIGLVSMLVGIYSRWTVIPIRGIEAHAFLQFSQTCFLFAIAVFLQHPSRE
ncbi:MAG TPA: hypothetical protein VGB20_06600 [bacterium]